MARFTSGTLVIVHHLVGYDRATEKVAYQHACPPDEWNTIRKFLRADDDDPSIVDIYPIDEPTIRDMMGVIHSDLPADLDYFHRVFKTGLTFPASLPPVAISTALHRRHQSVLADQNALGVDRAVVLSGPAGDDRRARLEVAAGAGREADDGRLGVDDDRLFAALVRSR